MSQNFRPGNIDEPHAGQVSPLVIFTYRDIIKAVIVDEVVYKSQYSIPI